MSLDSRVAGLPYESSSFATPASGGSPAKPDRGSERSEPISRMPIMPYDIESQFRNADFISIAAERQSATLSAAGAVAP